MTTVAPGRGKPSLSETLPRTFAEPLHLLRIKNAMNGKDFNNFLYLFICGY